MPNFACFFTPLLLSSYPEPRFAILTQRFLLRSTYENTHHAEQSVTHVTRLCVTGSPERQRATPEGAPRRQIACPDPTRTAYHRPAKPYTGDRRRQLLRCPPQPPRRTKLHASASASGGCARRRQVVVAKSDR